jgi:peptidoglycan/xylan/chitin deacetylase (PgdA/CDA1 family)
LRPKSWQDGARCAVALSFDVDHETNELRDGGQSIGRLAWGQFGNRVAVPRILGLLKAHDVRATFYVPAVVALLYPDEARRIVAEGHEVGVHGWIHELNSVLPYATERELVARSVETLENITGVRPVGMRTPSWDFSPHTLAIEKELGFAYDSSLMADEDCYELLLHGEPTGIVELPVEWIRDDAVYFSMHRFQSLRPYTPPEAVFDIFRRELEGAYAAGGVFQLTMHPHVIGYRSRIWIVEELIGLARSLGGVWFATHADIAAWAKDHG